MRIVMVLLLLGGMQSAIAITKCELKGKVTYKDGSCPEYASSKYLVKDKYVEESQLQKHKQKSAEQAEKDFKRMNTPVRRTQLNAEWPESKNKQIKPKQEQVSNETSNVQSQKVDKQDNKKNKINAPKMYDGVNDKLSEMERKLEKHNKELQQLQKQ